jgi:hypothetical protein
VSADEQKMPNGQPAQLANLRPFKPGNRAPRRSADVDRAIRLARKHSLEAILLAVECMRDAEAAWPERLKAVQLILNAGLPKDPDATDRALDENRGFDFLEIRFVSPDGSTNDTLRATSTMERPKLAAT